MFSVAQKKSPRPPDAFIIIIINFVCKSCHSTQLFPHVKIMEERKTRGFLSWSFMWSHQSPPLPLEPAGRILIRESASCSSRSQEGNAEYQASRRLSGSTGQPPVTARSWFQKGAAEGQLPARRVKMVASTSVDSVVRSPGMLPFQF